MKKISKIIVSIILLISFSACEEIISSSLDNETLKKIRSENINLKIQLDKLKKRIKNHDNEIEEKVLVISLYDLRHAVEKFALGNNGKYPDAKNINDLMDSVKPNLPEEYTIEMSYLETIKSNPKGYIFIANINESKIVVSNLI